MSSSGGVSLSLMLAGVSLVARGHRAIVDRGIDERPKIVVARGQVVRCRRAGQIWQETPVGFQVARGPYSAWHINEPCARLGARFGLRQARAGE